MALYLDLNVAPFTWQATEDYLRYMNDQYNKGALDPNFYLTTDDAAAKSKFVSGEVGTYGFYIANGTDVFASLLANDPNAEVAILQSTPGLAAEGYEPYYYEYPSYGMIMGINSTSSDEERAAVYMFLNWMTQPENLTFLQFGPEGETYTANDSGINVLNTGYTGEATLSQNQNKDYWCLVVESVTYGDEAKDLESNKLSLAPEGYTDLIQTSYDMCKAVEDKGIISPIFTKLSHDEGSLYAMMSHPVMDGVSGRTIVEVFEGSSQDYINYAKGIAGLDDTAQTETKDLNGKEVLVCKTSEQVANDLGKEVVSFKYLVSVPVVDGVALGFRIDGSYGTDNELVFDDSQIDLLLSNCAF